MNVELTTANHAPVTAKRMREAALRFLDSLDDGQRSVATFDFEGDERYEWSYVPVTRNGLRLKDMTQVQRGLAMDLMTSGLGVRASDQAKRIIDLDGILGEWERIQELESSWMRNPELYYYSVFGDPAARDPWAWRAGGHHIGIHFTIIDREIVSPLPFFFGANPAEVRHGPQKGSRTLPEEEDLARAVLDGLDADHKRQAIVDPVAPEDILTKNYRRVDPKMPLSGLEFSAMNGEQRERLVALIRHYVSRVAEEIADNEWRRIEAAGLDPITFAWAGPAERGKQHYYSVIGPQFMIEYDNTQNDGNHIHSVLRDFERDWGEDLLSLHYSESDHH